MPRFSFADFYRAANLAPGPEIIKLRQESIDELSGELDKSKLAELTRIAYGLAERSERRWFFDALSSNDASFSTFENEREVAVLATALLSKELADESVEAALMLVTAHVAGNRNLVIACDLVGDAQDLLLSSAVRKHSRLAGETGKITKAAASKTSDAITALLAAPGWAPLGQLLTQLADETSSSVTTLSGQVSRVVKPMALQIDRLQEEVDILWWFVSGWSDIGNDLFASLDLPAAAIWAGFDLGALTSTIPGPIAAKSLLFRLLTAGRERAALSQETTLAESVDLLNRSVVETLVLSEKLNSVLDICPLHAALLKTKEIGVSPAWHMPFKRSTELDVVIGFSPLDFARQAYLETLLIGLLDGSKIVRHH